MREEEGKTIKGRRKIIEDCGVGVKRDMEQICGGQREEGEYWGNIDEVNMWRHKLQLYLHFKVHNRRAYKVEMVQR